LDDKNGGGKVKSCVFPRKPEKKGAKNLKKINCGNNRRVLAGKRIMGRELCGNSETHNASHN